MYCAGVIVVAFAQFVVFGPGQDEDETFILPDPDSGEAFRCFTRNLAELG